MTASQKALSVNAKEAYNHGFAICGRAYIFEVPGIMNGCLGVKDGEPGYQFDTIDGELGAWQLSTTKISSLDDCELIPKIQNIVDAIETISKVIGKEDTFRQLSIIFELLGMERV